MRKGGINENNSQAKLRRKTKSRLRHPKIALSFKQKNQMRAFSINTHLEEEGSVISKGSLNSSRIKKIADVPFFK